ESPKSTADPTSSVSNVSPHTQNASIQVVPNNASQAAIIEPSIPAADKPSTPIHSHKTVPQQPIEENIRPPSLHRADRKKLLSSIRASAASVVFGKKKHPADSKSSKNFKSS